MSRIAVIDLLFNWPPDGGARTDIKEICSRLARSHEVRLYVPDFPYHFPRGMIEGRLSFPVEKVPFTPISFSFLAAGRRFKNYVARFRPDHLFIADGWFLKPYIVNALREYKPVVRFYAYECLCFNLHGTFMRDGAPCDLRWMAKGAMTQMRCSRCGVTEMWRKRYYHFLHEFLASLAFLPSYGGVVRRALRNARTVIVYNPFAKDLIAGLARSVQVTPSGVDHLLFSPRPLPRGELKKILMVGRIADETKGFPLLLGVCRELWKERRDFRLLVTTEWERRYDDPFIETRTWMPQERLPSLYAEADLCVFPSLWEEPQGIAPLEAMACARPVIASRVGGLQHLIKDGIHGYLFRAGDAAALKRNIVELLDDGETRERMGRAARKRVEENYTWDIIYERHYRHLFG